MSPWIAVLFALVSAEGPTETPAGEIRASMPSLHMSEHEAHRGTVNLEVDGTDMGRTPNMTVFGFLPYWSGQTHLRYDLITILACFCVDMDSSGGISDRNGFPEIFTGAIEGISEAGGTAVVTVVNFSARSIHSILTKARPDAIPTMVGLVENYPVNGICIDFENVGSDDRNNLTSFMEELRCSLDIHVPGSHLSLCTPAVDWNGSFDYDALAKAVDAVFVMCYPFHGIWSDEAGPCCPLTGWGSGPESPSNMVWCMGDYVKHAPGSHSKLVFGIPYYGHEWDTAGPSAHSSATGKCVTLTYRSLAAGAGEHGRLWDDESLTPWYAYRDGGWKQGWFDDRESLKLKYDLIRSSDFQGTGIWALGYDGSREELWDCLEESFCGEPWTDSLTDDLESRLTLHGPPKYWHNVTRGGWYHGYFYTNSISSGPDVNRAEWTFQLPSDSGWWELEAYLPRGGEAQAAYRIESASGTDTVVIDQSLYQGQWVPLGGPWNVQNGLRVILGDRTGSTGRKIVVDAIRLVSPSGFGEEEPDMGEPGLPASPNPGVSFTLTASCRRPGRLTVYDVSGRAVFTVGLDTGDHVITWPQERGTPPGVYAAVLESGSRRRTTMLVLLKK